MSLLELHKLHCLDGACILSADGTINKFTVDAFEQGLVVGLARSSRLVVDLTSCTVLLSIPTTLKGTPCPPS